MSKSKNILEQTFKGLLVAIPASFPYSRKLSSLLTVLLAAIWLFMGNYRNIRGVLHNKYWLLFVCVFLIPAFSLLYSVNQDYSLLEKRLFLLIYPLLLCTSAVSHATVKNVLLGFAISCGVASAYALGTTLYYNEPLSTEMTLQHLGITHVYFGLYLACAIVFLGYMLIDDETFNRKSIWLAGLIVFLLFFLFALGAKMSIISLFLLVLIWGIGIIIKTRRWIMGAFLVLLPGAIFLATITNFDTAYYRFYDLLNPENYFVGDNAWNSIGVRLSIFKCGLEIYKDIPLFGTGIGDVQNDLDSCYADLGLTTLRELNMHNQYFQFLLGTGIFSLVIFLLAFFYPVVQAFRVKNKLYLYFMFLFLFCCLTEALLERQHGTMLYGFFNALLFSGIPDKLNINPAPQTLS